MGTTMEASTSFNYQKWEYQAAKYGHSNLFPQILQNPRSETLVESRLFFISGPFLGGIYCNLNWLVVSILLKNMKVSWDD